MIAPDQKSGHRIDRVDIADDIAEVQQRLGVLVRRRPWGSNDAGAHFGGGMKLPAQTTAGPIQCINAGILSSQVNRSAGERRL